jgi:ankyrin repeat protein
MDAERFIDVFRCLLNANANINAERDDGSTPLHLLASWPSAVTTPPFYEVFSISFHFHLLVSSTSFHCLFLFFSFYIFIPALLLLFIQCNSFF